MKPLSQFISGCKAKTESGTTALSNTERKNLEMELARLTNNGNNPSTQKFVMDISGSTPHTNENYSPCLTRTRAGSSGFYLSWLQRKMTTDEILKLQGVDPKSIPSVVSPRQLRLIAGNAVPVDLLTPVIKASLKAGGLKLLLTTAVVVYEDLSA